jgi:hypothetical protein
MSKRWYDQSMQSEPNGYLACYAGLIRVWIKFYPELLKGMETSRAVERREAANDEDLFAVEEADWLTMLQILLGELWGDALVLVILGITAFYFYRQRR